VHLPLGDQLLVETVRGTSKRSLCRSASSCPDEHVDRPTPGEQHRKPIPMCGAFTREPTVVAKEGAVDVVSSAA
jgi:hypothetical protein